MFGHTASEFPAPIDRANRVFTRWNEQDDQGKTLREQVIERLRGQEQAGGERDLQGIRLIDEDLSGLDLSGVNLANADLSRANLTGAKLVGAILTRACLHGATLTDAECLKADFSHADLSECIAERTGFGHANLRRAQLFSANLNHSTFAEADLRHADLRRASLRHCRLKKAQLCHAEFGRADLRDADLEGADVDHAHFVEADLRASRLRTLKNFSNGVFLHADIRDVDFSGAYLLRRQIMDENYLHEFKSAGTANRITYWVWWVTSDCGRSMLRFALWIFLITAAFGVAYGFVNIDYGRYPTALSPYYFSCVTLTTLGYGDVLPASTAAQVVVMLEVFAGYMSLGGLLSIFSNKMARRGE